MVITKICGQEINTQALAADDIRDQEEDCIRGLEEEHIQDQVAGFILDRAVVCTLAQEVDFIQVRAEDFIQDLVADFILDQVVAYTLGQEEDFILGQGEVCIPAHLNT